MPGPCVQLVVLAIQIAQAIATAAVTFGASLAEIPIFRQITKMRLDQALDIAINTGSMGKRGAGNAGIFRPIVNWLRKSLRKGGGKGPGSSPNAPHSGPPRYPNQRPMLDKYRNETDPNSHPFLGQSVRRLTPEQREAHRVYIDGNGIMFD